MQQTVSAELSESSLARLEARAGHGRAVGILLTQAVYYFLADGHSGRAAWSYPRFRRDPARREASVSVPLRIESRTWDAFRAEAAYQDISVALLLEHATLYLLADLDSGRATERILRNWS